MPFGEARTLGFNNQPLAKLIVANSIINKQGMFFYSATPAFGNLIESIGVTSASTDKFGNAYQAGDTAYTSVSGTFYAAQLTGSSIIYFKATGAGGPWTQVATVAYAGAINTFVINVIGQPLVVGSSAAVTTEQLEVKGNIAASLIKSIISGAAETWHNAVLATGFAAGGTTPRFRQVPIGITQPTMVLDGAVNLTATEAANTTMFTLPVSPLNAHDYTTKSTLSGLNPGAGVMPATVHVDTGGHVQIAVNGVSGNFVVLDGITIPLD